MRNEAKKVFHWEATMLLWEFAHERIKVKRQLDFLIAYWATPGSDQTISAIITLSMRLLGVETGRLRSRHSRV